MCNCMHITASENIDPLQQILQARTMANLKSDKAAYKKLSDKFRQVHKRNPTDQDANELLRMQWEFETQDVL